MFFFSTPRWGCGRCLRWKYLVEIMGIGATQERCQSKIGKTRIPNPFPAYIDYSHFLCFPRFSFSNTFLVIWFMISRIFFPFSFLPFPLSHLFPPGIPSLAKRGLFIIWVAGWSIASSLKNNYQPFQSGINDFLKRSFIRINALPLMGRITEENAVYGGGRGSEMGLMRRRYNE